jgi:hypothetical protein
VSATRVRVSGRRMGAWQEEYEGMCAWEKVNNGGERREAHGMKEYWREEELTRKEIGGRS